MQGMKPVKVHSCSDRVQADMLIEALKREGIPAYAESKGSGDYLNIYMGTSESPSMWMKMTLTGQRRS